MRGRGRQGAGGEDQTHHRIRPGKQEEEQAEEKEEQEQ